MNSSQALLFTFLYELPSWSKAVPYNGLDYYSIKKEKVVVELPLLTDKPNTVGKLLNQLVELDVISRALISNRTHIAITEKGKLWNKKDDCIGSLNGGGKKSKGWKKIQSSVEKNPEGGKKSTTDANPCSDWAEGSYSQVSGVEKNPPHVSVIYQYTNISKIPTNVGCQISPKSDSPAAAKKSQIPYEDIHKLYQTLLVETGADQPRLVDVQVLTKKRKIRLRQFWDLVKRDMGRVEKYFAFIWEHRADHSWIFGSNDRGWVADIEFVCREETLVKAREGRLGNFNGGDQ